EPVDLIVNNAESEKRARKTLKLANALNKNVRFHRWPTNRVWTRDSGCAFVRTREGGSWAGVPAPNSELLAIKWRFNAWAKYPNYRYDEKIGSLMAEAAKTQEIPATHKGARVVLEGGSIDVNGSGVLLTTEECLLSKVQQRNPGFQREDYDEVF